MLISHSRRFIFIHIVKTAGTSIKRVLWPYQPFHVRVRGRIYEALRWSYMRTFSPPSLDLYKNSQDNTVHDKRPLNGLMNAVITSLSYRGIWHHYTATMIREVIPDIFDQYYKFAFVRNPWDWQVSSYHYMLERPWHVAHGMVESFGSFEKYLEFMCPYMAQTRQRQKDYLTDENGRIIVDFVGRFENLAEDFRVVCEKIEIPYSLTYVNRSHRREPDYRKYYTDRTAELVAKHFKDDIEMFGYKF